MKRFIGLQKLFRKEKEEHQVYVFMGARWPWSLSPPHAPCSDHLGKGSGICTSWSPITAKGRGGPRRPRAFPRAHRSWGGSFFTVHQSLWSLWLGLPLCAVWNRWTYRILEWDCLHDLDLLKFIGDRLSSGRWGCTSCSAHNHWGSLQPQKPYFLCQFWEPYECLKLVESHVLGLRRQRGV